MTFVTPAAGATSCLPFQRRGVLRFSVRPASGVPFPNQTLSHNTAPGRKGKGTSPGCTWTLGPREMNRICEKWRRHSTLPHKSAPPNSPQKTDLVQQKSGHTKDTALDIHGTREAPPGTNEWFKSLSSTGQCSVRGQTCQHLTRDPQKRPHPSLVHTRSQTNL